MKESITEITIVTLGILMFAIVTFGYFNNLYQLTQTDFEAPYKAEVLRTTGVFIPPLGVVFGYVDLGD